MHDLENLNSSQEHARWFSKECFFCGILYPWSFKFCSINLEQKTSTDTDQFVHSILFCYSIYTISYGSLDISMTDDNFLSIRPFTRPNFTVITKLFLFSIQHEFVSFCTINIPKWPKKHFIVKNWEWFTFWFMVYQFSFATSDVTHVPNGGSYSIVRISFRFFSENRFCMAPTVNSNKTQLLLHVDYRISSFVA